MQYELRQFLDSTRTDYIVKATSNDIEVLRAYMDKPSVPNDVWYRLHVVDVTESAISK
jgi:hypothetical protein